MDLKDLRHLQVAIRGRKYIGQKTYIPKKFNVVGPQRSERGVHGCLARPAIESSNL